MDPVETEIFQNLFISITEQMGAILERTGYSPNIKERRDFSCALFNSDGEMFAQAMHIPVHLGAMPETIRLCVKNLQMEEGDVLLVNDPYNGGTHLPDLTMISPIQYHGQLVGYAANRAHHSDIGGITPGSMSLSRELYQEGLVLPPVKLFSKGIINHDLLKVLMANVRTPAERLGDLKAQKAANDLGIRRVQELYQTYSSAKVVAMIREVLDHSERMMEAAVWAIPDGEYRFEDYVDDDGMGHGPLMIRVRIRIKGNLAEIDFSGTDEQVEGPVNAVRAVTVSAVHYAVRAVVSAGTQGEPAASESEIPVNSGCFRLITVLTRPGTLVHALPPAATAAGNVETSQRIVDVVLGALAKALPDRIPSASSGSMNNVSLGGYDEERNQHFSYYETIGGGAGAGPWFDGESAVHTHMTNTLNTPVEALEFAYPLMVTAYEIRRNSGGQGRFRGGDGITRIIVPLCSVRGALLADRRKLRPYGLAGGQGGEPGDDQLHKEGSVIKLASKTEFTASPGDRIIIKTPGGGGWGEPAPG